MGLYLSVPTGTANTARFCRLISRNQAPWKKWIFMLQVYLAAPVAYSHAPLSGVYWFCRGFAAPWFKGSGGRVGSGSQGFCCRVEGFKV